MDPNMVQILAALALNMAKIPEITDFAVQTGYLDLFGVVCCKWPRYSGQIQRRTPDFSLEAGDPDPPQMGGLGSVLDTLGHILKCSREA